MAVAKAGRICREILSRHVSAATPPVRQGDLAGRGCGRARVQKTMAMATDGCRDRSDRGRREVVPLSTRQALYAKYRVDRTPAALEALVRACTPLVASVCWRYLRRPEDVD